MALFGEALLIHKQEKNYLHSNASLLTSKCLFSVSSSKRMAFASTSSPSIPFPSISPSAATRKPNYTLLNLSDDPSSAAASSSKPSLRVSAASKARFVARRKDSVTVLQLQRPLSEYMSLPASQYSVLDAERIERVDEETFRCYVYRFKFFAFEVCPVLVVRVEVEDDGCSIKLLSCKLEGSPIVVAQNDKFDASMTNRITYSSSQNGASPSRLTSDAVIEVNIEIPFAFRAIPKEAIESMGTQILDQILKMMLPRFMSQLVKDYQAWASGDTSRQPLGTGKI